MLSWVIGHSSWPYRNALCNHLRARKGMDQIPLRCDWAVVCEGGGGGGEGRAFRFLKYVCLCGFGVL